MGQNHQHWVHACQGGITLQECVQRSKTRHSRFHQDCGIGGSSEGQHHLQLHMPRLCADRPDQEPAERHCQSERHSRGTQNILHALWQHLGMVQHLCIAPCMHCGSIQACSTACALHPACIVAAFRHAPLLVQACIVVILRCILHAWQQHLSMSSCLCKCL